MQEKIQKLKSINILFVEDEEDLVKIIGDTLTKLQAKFHIATNGKIALDKFIELDGKIDLVVTDINMPIMSGLELIAEIQKIDKDMPFIIMSAHTEPQYIRAAEELGVPDYLLKPFDFIKFIDLVYKLDIEPKS